MAARKKAKKKAARRVTARRRRPYPLSITITTDILRLKPSLRDRLCELLCCTDFPPMKVRMGGYCVIKRWIDGNQRCEQRICYDAAGDVYFRGPILCTPI